MGVGFTTGIPEYNEKGFHTSVNDVNCKYDDKSNEFGQITNADGHLFNYDSTFGVEYL